MPGKRVRGLFRFQAMQDAVTVAAGQFLNTTSSGRIYILLVPASVRILHLSSTGPEAYPDNGRLRG
jgi:hypothetical protein